MKLKNILIPILILLPSKLNSADNQFPESKFDGQMKQFSYVMTDEADESCNKHCISALRHFLWALTSLCRKKSDQKIIVQYTPNTANGEIQALNSTLEINSRIRNRNYLLKGVEIE